METEKYSSLIVKKNKTPCPSTPRDFFARLYGHLESEKKDNSSIKNSPKDDKTESFISSTEDVIEHDVSNEVSKQKSDLQFSSENLSSNNGLCSGILWSEDLAKFCAGVLPGQNRDADNIPSSSKMVTSFEVPSMVRGDFNPVLGLNIEAHLGSGFSAYRKF